jgi:uncharacterized protein (DUF2236 family)
VVRVIDVGGVTEAWRTRLLELFSGTADGRPAWVTAIEDGDDGGYFGPGSAAWAVHGGMPTLVAGIRALLMQTLHPGAMAGVHDWSRYKEDPLGRLTGTIRWLITVTFADTATAIEQSERVKGYHGRVRGTYLDARGQEQPYSAGDPELLSWVHIVFTDAFLSTHRIWGSPIPGGPDQYVREWGKAGELMGVPTPPRSEEELRAQISAFRDRGILKSDERVAETVRFIQHPPLKREMLPGYRILFAGAVASLEPEYREMLGLKLPALGPIPLPAIAATRVTLSAVGAALGTRSPSEEAARRRIARVAAARSDVAE